MAPEAVGSTPIIRPIVKTLQNVGFLLIQNSTLIDEGHGYEIVSHQILASQSQILSA